ncbi:MAG: hypothetical protein HY866_14820, partial [Chloroflexi bacterium]|nr:hypothetical protein [Chloroflexota bacterium]
MTADFDRQAAHRHFAVECFNQTWDLIDKANRTARDNEKMIGLSMASLWHWSQRKDCTPTNISVGCWLVSRVYALIGQADNARHYGQMCLEASHGDGVAPFYLGCAYEALARAEKVAGN